MSILPFVVISLQVFMHRFNGNFNIHPPGQTSSISLLSVPGERGICWVRPSQRWGIWSLLPRWGGENWTGSVRFPVFKSSHARALPGVSSGVGVVVLNFRVNRCTSEVASSSRVFQFWCDTSCANPLKFPSGWQSEFDYEFILIFILLPISDALRQDVLLIDSLCHAAR